MNSRVERPPLLDAIQALAEFTQRAATLEFQRELDYHYITTGVVRGGTLRHFYQPTVARVTGVFVTLDHLVTKCGEVAQYRVVKLPDGRVARDRNRQPIKGWCITEDIGTLYVTELKHLVHNLRRYL